jgi:hypothetical protein
MPINTITTSNTFQQWLIATQQLISFENSLANSSGTFTIAGNLIVGNTVTCATVNTNIIIFSDGTTLNSNNSVVYAVNNSDAAFNKANLANVLAQAAFDKANTGTVAGSNTQVQFNNSGSFGASSGLTFDGVTLTSTQITGRLKSYKESVTNLSTVTANTASIDLSLSNIFDVTLGNNVTFTFTNPPASGIAQSCTIILRQDVTGNRTATFANSRYTDGSPPVLSTGANQIDVLTFFTVDGGLIYFGAFAMANVS